MQNPAATAAGHRAGSAEGAEGQAAHRPGGGAQLQYIQGLRFVAMAWIIAYHYLDRDGSAALVRFVDDRPLDLFTVISGFVTHFAYAHRTQLSGPCVFVLRRCSKLFFMYYFSLFLSLCLKLVWLGLRAAPSPQSSVWLEGTAFTASLFGLNVWFSVLEPILPAEGAPPVLAALRESIWPVNGPVWYIQTIAFCWFTYPVLRPWLPGPNGSGARTAGLMVLLWVVGVLPSVVLLILGDEGGGCCFNFIKLFPVLMLPSFYLGAAACDLYMQQTRLARQDGFSPLVADPTLEAERGVRGQTPTTHHPSPSLEGGGSWMVGGDGSGGMPPGLACLIGELMFVGFFAFVLLVPYPPVLRLHVWSIVFGVILFVWACATHEQADDRKSRGGAMRMGVKWLLETPFAGVLGDVSLVAFSLQCPLSKVYMWTVRSPSFHSDDWRVLSWMSPLEFTVFFAGLYGLSYLVSQYIDKPLSSWVSTRIVDATAHSTW